MIGAKDAMLLITVLFYLGWGRRINLNQSWTCLVAVGFVWEKLSLYFLCDHGVFKWNEVWELWQVRFIVVTNDRDSTVDSPTGVGLRGANPLLLAVCFTFPNYSDNDAKVLVMEDSDYAYPNGAGAFIIRQQPLIFNSSVKPLQWSSHVLWRSVESWFL